MKSDTPSAPAPAIEVEVDGAADAEVHSAYDPECWCGPDIEHYEEADVIIHKRNQC